MRTFYNNIVLQQSDTLILSAVSVLLLLLNFIVTKLACIVSQQTYLIVSVANSQQI